MNAFGHTELTSKELPNGLEFRVDTEFGWFPLLVLFLLPVGFLIFSLTISASGLRAVFALISLAFLVWMGVVLARRWNRTDTTTLSVTNQDFVATGAGLKWLSSGATEIVPAREVTSFGYSSGGEDDPSGLYVSCGFWKSKCLLPGLNRLQATSVAVAIARRFPEIASKVK